MLNEVGVRLDLLVMGWVFGALVVITVLLWLGFRKSDVFDGDPWLMGALFSAAFTVIIGIGLAVLLWPYSTEYYKVYRVSGTVEKVTNKMVEASGEFSESTVLTLDTVDRPVVMSDPRGVTLEGKQVDLTCSINWHYMAQDTYHCEIYSIGENQ